MKPASALWYVACLALMLGLDMVPGPGARSVYAVYPPWLKGGAIADRIASAGRYRATATSLPFVVKVASLGAEGPSELLAHGAVLVAAAPLCASGGGAAP